MFKKILISLREFKLPSILTGLFIVLEVIIECFIPFITSNLINNLENHSENINLIINRGLLLLLMAFLSLTFGGLAGLTSAKASSGFARNLRGDIFRKIQGFSFQNIDRFSSSSLVTRLTTDVSNVQMAYMLIIRNLVRAPLMMFFSIIMAYRIGGKLATSFVIILPVMIIGLYLIGHFALPTFRRIFVKYDHLNESIEENVRAMRVVKGYAREEFEKNKFAKAAEAIRVDFTKAERIVALNSPLMQLCVYFNLIFVLYFGAKLIITNHAMTIGVGEISAMLTYGIQIMIQVMMLTMVYVMITMSSESMKRIQEVLGEQSSITSPANAITVIPNGEVIFENVNFKYSERAEKNALSNINLSIDSGMTVGILGGTGDGKSSLVQLIPRLYDTTEGVVKVGGIDVQKYDLLALRNAVSVVLQKNVLFSGTIKENLRWGNEDATDEEIIHACQLAQAHDFIMEFPNQYDTKIEQGGTNVSGGQKQRLCIARALLKQPKILILDDSTSAVDTKTDSLIREGFAEFIPDITKIIISQRVSSIEHADMIVVMENGYIVDQGNHHQLLERCRIYQEIHAQQSKGGDSNEQE